MVLLFWSRVLGKPRCLLTTLETYTHKSLSKSLKMNSACLDLCAVFRLQKGSKVMLLLTLMTIGVHMMQFANWKVRMASKLRSLTTLEIW